MRGECCLRVTKENTIANELELMGTAGKFLEELLPMLVVEFTDEKISGVGLSGSLHAVRRMG